MTNKLNQVLSLEFYKGNKCIGKYTTFFQYLKLQEQVYAMILVNIATILLLTY